MTLGALRVCANLDWPLTFGLPVLSINNLQNISFGKVHVALTLKARSAFMISFLLGLDILLASNIWVPCIFKNRFARHFVWQDAIGFEIEGSISISDLLCVLQLQVDSLATMRRWKDRPKEGEEVSQEHANMSMPSAESLENLGILPQTRPTDQGESCARFKEPWGLLECPSLMQLVWRRHPQFHFLGSLI